MSIPIGHRFLTCVLLAALASGSVRAESADASGGDPTPAGGPASQPASASPDDFLMNSGSLVNDFTGQPSFTLPLATVTGGNGLQFGATLQYFGGVEDRDRTNVQFQPGSWVGLGFSMVWPQVTSDTKGTAALEDDEYFLSLDGQSVRLVGTNNNANTFYPKNSRAISVTRFTTVAASQTINDPFVPAAPNNSPPAYPATFSVPYVYGWRVDMPDGKSIHFEFSGNCETDNGVICTPATVDNLGYQPFFNYSSNARVPEQWNATRILDRDSKFAIFFEYAKAKETVIGNEYAGTGAPASPQVTADRAVYLHRVYSVNGTAANSQLLGEMRIFRKAKPVADYFESGWGNPLARFEKECIDYINVANLGKNVRKYVFDYGSTLRSKLRLDRITEVEPVFGKSKVLHQFLYDPSAPWRMTKLVDQAGVESEFEWSQAAGLKFSNTYDLSGFFTSLAGTKIKTKLEYGNNYFFSVESEAACADPSGYRKDKLFQFRNNGGYWELAHVFYAPKVDCAGEFFLAPDASYFLHVARTNGTTSEITAYDLPLKEDYANHPNGVPRDVDLATSPLITKTTFANLPGGGTSFKKSVFVFKKWFSYVSAGEGKIRFFYRGNSNAWRDGTKDAAGNPINCIVSQTSYSGITENRTNCLDFANTTLDVRAGSDFLAVLNKSPNEPRRSVLHVYGYNGGIKEYLKGLRKSKTQKNLSGWGSTIGGTEVWNVSPDNQDYYNVWDYTIHDWSVSGNIIVINAQAYLGSSHNILYAFGWDGNQLRFLHRDNNVSPLTLYYAGPDYFVTQQVSQQPSSPNTWFYLTKFDLKRWKALPAQLIAAKTSYSGQWWTAKCMPGFVFLERMAFAEIAKTYEPAIIGQDADYPHKNENGLYNLHGADGSSIAEAPISLPNNHRLGNIEIQQDRILGIAVPASGTTEGSHYFGKLNPGPSGNPAAQSSPSWPLTPFTEEGTWGSKSAALLSSGAVMFRYASQQFNGLVQFSTEQAGALSRASAPSQPWVVSKVHVRTRGTASSYSDATLKTVAFSYQDGGLPYGAVYNAFSQTPNFKVVRKSRQIYGDNVTTVQATYRMDVPDPPLPTSQKGLHGSLESMRFEPAGNATAPGAWSRTSRIASDQVSNTPNGAYPLKESLFQLRGQGGEERQHYFSHYMENRQDFARVDAFMGRPTVTVSQQGSDYRVRIVRYEHEFTSLQPRDLVRQTADFLFKSNPCLTVNGEYCGNITPAWLLTAPQNGRAVASQILKYSSARMLTETWQWRPLVTGTALPNLDGNTASGTWILVSTVLERNRDNAAARNKHLDPTVTNTQGVNSVFFYGGAEGRLLGTVKNSARNTCTILTGEEASLTAGRFGAFGEWENGGASLSQTVVHTGSNSFKSTQVFGPTIDIRYWNGGSNSYWLKKKGFLVSAWIYAEGDRNSSATDPSPSLRIELRNSTGGVAKEFDLVTEFPAANLPYNKWVKLSRHLTWSELETWTPNQNSYLRIWAGKANSNNTKPVYVDDFRIHPADASSSSSNYDELGRVTSVLDGNNEPTYLQYDVWGKPIGGKDARGFSYGSSGAKAFNE